MLKLASRIVLPLCLCACATPPRETPREIPPALNVPPGNRLLFELHAVGVQIYTCAPKKDDASKYEWTFKAPDARLLSEHGQEVGHHYAGPTWEWKDGSKVVGKLEQKVDAKGAADIPWLLLSAKSHADRGQFETVSFIQRLDTQGGKPPAEACDQEHAGTEVRVEYEATYGFYVPDN